MVVLIIYALPGRVDLLHKLLPVLSLTQWMSHRDIVIFSLYCGPCRWTPAVVAVTYLFMYPSLRYTHSLALVNFFCMVSCECVGGVMLALL